MQPEKPVHPDWLPLSIFRDIARVNAVGKKRKQFKKPRTRDGVVFSEISKDKKDSVKYIKKMYGEAPFKNPDHEVWKLMISMGRSFRAENNLKEDFFIDVCDIGLIYKFGQGEYHSIYINSLAVMDFLENSEPRQSDGMLLKQSAINLQKKSNGGGLAIHLPGRKESIFISSLDNVSEVVSRFSENDVVVNYFRGEDVGFTPIKKDGSWVTEKTSEDSNLLDLDWKIIFNLFLYIDAFPECVIDGPPDLISGYANETKVQTVNSNDSISQVFERSKAAPHMRRGHFRVLKSERFTKKRYQAVFVKPAMVLGKASTLVEYQ